MIYEITLKLGEQSPGTYKENMGINMVAQNYDHLGTYKGNFGINTNYDHFTTGFIKLDKKIAVKHSKEMEYKFIFEDQDIGTVNQ